MKYRKKPVVIEAVQFTDEPDRVIELQEFMNADLVINYNDKNNPKLKIATLEGVMDASIGDYIIKGVNNEFYPCKPDIFHKTYEPILKACYGMVKERHPNATHEEIIAMDDEEYACQETPKGRFMVDWCKAYDIAKKEGRIVSRIIVAVQLPSHAIEIIINTDELNSKFQYYTNAYDDNLQLKVNNQIKIIGWLFV